MEAVVVQDIHDLKKIIKALIKVSCTNKTLKVFKHLPGLMQDIPQAPSHKHFFFLLLQSSSELHFLKHF